MTIQSDPRDGKHDISRYNNEIRGILDRLEELDRETAG
jgi:hypothetical protein